jgi:hypothetical protein
MGSPSNKEASPGRQSDTEISTRKKKKDTEISE